MIRFLYVARSAPHKGLSDLLLVLQRLQRTDWRLTVVGAVAEVDVDVVRDVKLRFGRRITALGAQPLKRVADIMRRHDALIVPSRYENFCNVALEALACGLPVIGVAMGGIRDMVTHGTNGLLFEPRSATALAAAITWALDHQEQLALMRPAARRVAKRYSWPVVAEITSELFLAILRARGRGDP
ncbi:MAG: glycosyltransferase family 4 protein [Thermoanaerobaculia bacterium]